MSDTNILRAEHSEEEQKEAEDLILKDCVFIKKKDTLEKVHINDILFLESEGNYCGIFTKSKRFVLKMSLRTASKILSSNNFIRINKSVILNLNEVSSIVLSKNQMILGNKTFPIGRTYKIQILKRLRIMT